MSENPAPTDGERPKPLMRFEVTPYRPRGGFGLGGAIVLLAACVAVGIVLGAIFSWISHVFFLAFLFPIVIGGFIGIVGVRLVRLGKIRSRFVAGLAGCLGVCAAMLTMHYCNYLLFERELESEIEATEVATDLSLKALREAVQRRTRGEPMSQAEEEGWAAAQETLSADLVAAFPVHDFAGFMQYKATRGVALVYAGTRALRVFPLSRPLTIAYWLAEILIAAFVAFRAMRDAAGLPFCTRCGNWKEHRLLGTLEQPEEKAVAAVTIGDIAAIRALGPKALSGELEVTAAVCPRCLGASPVDVKLNRVIAAKSGQTKTKELAHIRYPAEAWPVLEGLFRPAMTLETKY